ncbi:MAG: helix-turn-helix transcriptional regulator [Treponema sp.]|nr:helix-turn-helix transcriptional regulator [Treponema sp.]
MTKRVTVPDIYSLPPGKAFDGSVYLPKEVGKLKLLKKECSGKISYYDWDLSFVDETFASREDNFGKDEIQLIFNLSQPIEWQIDGGRELVNMQPGEVCVFRNNNCRTSMNYDKSVSFLFKSIQMPTGYFEQLLSRYFPETQIERCKVLFLSHVTKTLITQDMYRVLSEIDSSEKFREFSGVFIEGKMIELIALVLYGISYHTSESKPRKNVASLTASLTDRQRLEALRQRIQLNPSEDYHASELAAGLSMSESKLTRLFRSLYGISFHRYVQEQRLERAATLIAQGGVNISEAAQKSGYTNMSWFSKEFKEKFGISPKKFAMQSQKDASRSQAD